MNYFLIGDLAKICDVNIKTIRFYEEKNYYFLHILINGQDIV